MIAFAVTVLLALPNPHLTPGAVRPLTTATVCSTRWGLDKRAVTTKNKQDVFAAYGIPWADRAQYEVDHRISRDIGGSDPVKGSPATLNLWPQPLYEAKHYKDPLEVKLHTLVCRGTISLSEAQEALRGDWTAAYVKYMGRKIGPVAVPAR